MIGLRPRAERTDHHEVLACVDEGIRLGLELVEVLRDPCEDIVRNALRATIGALGGAPPPGSHHSICGSKASKTAGMSARLNAS